MRDMTLRDKRKDGRFEEDDPQGLSSMVRLSIACPSAPVRGAGLRRRLRCMVWLSIACPASPACRWQLHGQRRAVNCGLQAILTHSAALVYKQNLTFFNESIDYIRLRIYNGGRLSAISDRMIGHGCPIRSQCFHFALFGCNLAVRRRENHPCPLT